MSTTEAAPPIDPPPPGAEPAYAAGGPARGAWYKRTWLLVTAAVVVVVGASVLIDLPRPISNAQDIASQTATINQINQDVTPCGYAVNETFVIHRDQVAGTLTASDRTAAPKMLTDDQTACSFTNGAIYDLTNNIQVQETAAGRYVDNMLGVTTTWATSDALAAVEDMQTLYLHPGDARAQRDLAHQEHLLTVDRSRAVLDIQQADALLHAHLPVPNIPVTASP